MFDDEGEEEFRNILARIAFGVGTDPTAVDRGAACVTPYKIKKQIVQIDDARVVAPLAKQSGESQDAELCACVRMCASD